jgi:hypothetical protein
VGIGVNAFTGADHELPDITWNVPVLLTAMHHVVVGHARAAGHPTYGLAAVVVHVRWVVSDSGELTGPRRPGASCATTV